MDDRYEQAVVLVMTALEAELGLILEDQENIPDKIEAPYDPEKRTMYRMIEEGKNYFTESALQEKDGSLRRLWKQAHEARKRRNDIIHRTRGITKNAKNRGKVLVWLDCVRRLTALLDRWRQNTFH
ncbi:MAG: hypothetical protein GF309_13230 [Candidatus Lokiarchaeota archaeon]|nr:hypothetical protein [Candidatus Lokiarchaeota archaeon]